MWTNWYEKRHWMLWARAANPDRNPDRIGLFKTTMLIEAYWKVIKRNFLPKLFRPRLDLVVYVITTRLLPHHQRRYYQLTSRPETVAWRKDFKKEWKNLSNRNSAI